MVDLLLAALFLLYDKNASFVSLGIGTQLKDAYKMITSTMIIDTVIRKNYTTLFLAITYKGYVFFL